MKTIPRRPVTAFWLVMLGLMVVPSAGQTPAQGPPAWQWPLSTPEEQGLDPKVLAEVVELIRTGELLPWLHYLVIVRHGRLVLEENFHGWGPGKLHTLQSVSKSFTSALVGIAIARGEFKGVDEKVLDFFPDMKEIANLDDRKAALRLEDILTMRTGTDYHENGPDSPHYQLNALATGWDKFYLDRPMLGPPGKEFRYDSGGVILLSAMLKARTGMHAEEYASRFSSSPSGSRSGSGSGTWKAIPIRAAASTWPPGTPPSWGSSTWTKGVGGTSRSCPRNGSKRPSRCTST